MKGIDTFFTLSDDRKLGYHVHGDFNGFSVFRLSGGGGEYAAALAHKYPEYIHKCGLVSTVNQFGSKIPNCTKNFIEGKGHFLTEYPEIWQNILTSLK